MTSQRRYPLAVLLTIAGVTRRQAQTRLRISWTTLQRLEADGLTDEQADHYALRLGLYAWQVWPTWLQDGAGYDPDHPSVRGRVAPPSSSSEAS